MVAYPFKPRFVAPIRAGTKAQTIRAERRGPTRHARPGGAVSLYTGPRFRPEKLGVSSCLSVQPIRIELPRARVVPEVLIFTPEGALARHLVGPRELERFAQADGFQDFDDLHAFWCATHPGVDTFDGVLIRWAPLVAAEPFALAEAA